jgi:hypothetical protein
VDPKNPIDAQAVVAAYTALLAERSTQTGYPVSTAALPYPREVIRQSIQTATAALVASSQMTPELYEFLQSAYVSLADFLDESMVGLLHEPQRSHTIGWRRLSDAGPLVASLAQAIAQDAAALSAEFELLCDRQRASGKSVINTE